MTDRASSSPSSGRGWSYHVFLSFRGEDTRTGFTGHLYHALDQRGIRTFIDDRELQRGHQITPSLLEAIEDSRIAIVVLSEKYAFSSFCLDELAEIIECVKGNGRCILPVFYKVDPSDVRHERRSFGEALAMQEEKFKDNEKKVDRWRMALRQLADLSGWHFKQSDKYEYKLIRRIIEEVSSKIHYALLHVADYPVGLKSRILEVNLLLDVGSDDGVHVVGIYGIGGIGKTTLARAVYNLIADRFERSYFLDNVKDKSLAYLQEMFLCEILGDKYIKFGFENIRIQEIKQRLCRKKILLILDDVDKLKQLHAFVGEFDWFGSGSRVIITTRDKHLLDCYGVKRIHEVKELDREDALELLRWNAFKNDQVDTSYKNNLNRVITYASGLPLALEVIGSNLFGKRIGEWESALDQYERIPNKEIQKILKVSFDALEENEQKIFLDIACYLNGYSLADVEQILCAHHGVCRKYCIGVLTEKSLIKVNGYVTLHDLIRDMGREIVRQESSEDPGQRSRLWFFEDVVQVLEENTGTSKIQIIALDFPMGEQVWRETPECEVDWDGKAFKEMKNLKTLIIGSVHFSSGPKHLPNSLRVLKWRGYPSPSLPSDFYPKKLAILELPNSCIRSLESIKRSVSLKVLDVSNSEISNLPDVSGSPNLEKLSFRECKDLIGIHNSIGFLEKLRILDASGCSKLESFPPMKLTSLQRLELSKCSSLKSFPEILGKMGNIKGLSLKQTPIKELPFSIQNLTQLQRLFLEDCGTIQLPSSIFMLSELSEMIIWKCEVLRSSKQDKGKEEVSSMVCANMRYLDLSDCEISDEFLLICLAWFANLEYLNLSNSNLTTLPACIKECHYLRQLDLRHCKLLQEIRGIPSNLIFLDVTHCTSLTFSSTSMLLDQKLNEAGNKEFFLPATRIPMWFDRCSMGESISFWFRDKSPVIAMAEEQLLPKKRRGILVEQDRGRKRIRTRVKGTDIVSRKRKRGLSGQAPSKMALDSGSIMTSFVCGPSSSGGLRDKQRLTFMNQQNFEDRESVNNGEDMQMPMTKVKDDQQRLYQNFCAEGWVKCNVNVSCKQDDTSAGCGGVFTDSGAWLFGFVKHLGASSALMTELGAILTALQLAWSKGISSIWIESCLTCDVELVLRGRGHDHPCMSLLNSIRELLDRFRWVEISLASGEANRIARWLANSSHSLEIGLHLYDSPPVGCGFFGAGSL